jgi:lycopene cyclase domain-containing protein
MSEYMMVLIFSLAVPLGLSFWPGLGFYRHLKPLLFSLGLIVLVFGSWDVLATYRGHWYFAPQAVWPVRIINLPLEELLFFVVIPFCCIFTWEALNYLRQRLSR